MFKSIATAQSIIAKSVARLKPRAALISASICVLVFVSACGSSKVAKASRDLIDQIVHSSQTAKAVENRPAQAQEAPRVYLDGSISMSGFVNPTSPSTFDDFLDEIGNDLPGCLLYLYGQAGEQPPQDIGGLIRRIGFSRNLHDPRSYNLTYNPDDLLIESLANEETPALSVLISDGVYSEPMGGTSPPLVEATRKWMEKGRVLGILVFKSSFRGPFYSERRRAMTRPVSVAARPFYVFVFSPTEQEFKELQEKLQRKFPEMQSILFSNAAVSCGISTTENQKWIYSSKDAPKENYCWQMFNSGLIKQKNSGVVGYNINYQCLPDYPVAEFKPNIEVEYYKWERGGFKKVDEGLPTGFEVRLIDDGEKAQAEVKDGATTRSIVYASEQPKDSRPPEADSAASPPNLIVHFPKDLDSDYSFYNLSLSTSVKSLRKFIIDLSTRDDGVPENAGKTFRFFELITALTDVHFKTQLANKTSPSLFVTVANN